MDSKQVKNVLQELHEIAQEFNLPLDNINVLNEFNKRCKDGYSREVADFILFPIYQKSLAARIICVCLN